MTEESRYVRPRYAWAIAAALAVGIFAADVAAPVSLAGGDTLWSVPVAYSVIHERNVTLDEFPDLVKLTRTHTQVLADGHRVSKFPWGPSIVSVPLLAAYDGWLHLRHSSLREYLHTHFKAKGYTYADAALEKQLASFYAALSSVLLFFLLLRRTKNRLLAVLVSLAFAFGTSMFSTVSRALWSHAPSVLALMTGLYFLQLLEDHPEWHEGRLSLRGGLAAAACGGALGTAVFVRPTNAVPLAVILAALFLRQWRAGLAAAAGAAVPILTMIGIDYTTLGRPLQPYYQPGRAQPGNTFVGLAGNLVSPARGLLIWSPFVLLAVPAVVRAIRRPARDRVVTICMVVVVLHWLTIATLQPWWAGWSVGARLFSDGLPFLMLLVADGVLVLRDRLPRSWIRPAIAVGAVLVAFSLFTNVRAATHFSVQLWNTKPNVDTHSDRPWDWSNPQFLH